jgi:DNA-binding response OmpR family regulator
MSLSLLDLVTPDSALRRAVGEQLEAAGAWQIAAFATLAEALEAWGKRVPQAIVLDAAALGRETARLAEAVRTRSLPTPLFILGDAGTLADAVLTESFSKPLRLGHLLARLQFYRQVQGVDAEFTLGPLRFVPRARQLTVIANGDVIKLTDKESALLESLCRAENPMPRDELLASVWGYDGSIDTHTLETHIYRLRRAVPEGHDLFLVENGCYRINPAWRAG